VKIFNGCTHGLSWQGDNQSSADITRWTFSTTAGRGRQGNCLLQRLKQQFETQNLNSLSMLGVGTNIRTLRHVKGKNLNRIQSNTSLCRLEKLYELFYTIVFITSTKCSFEMVSVHENKIWTGLLISSGIFSYLKKLKLACEISMLFEHLNICAPPPTNLMNA
jgi:hypothetical protein